MDAETTKLCKNDKNFSYGTSMVSSSNDTDKDFASKKVIFCVHGQLSGCCTLVMKGTEEQIISNNFYKNLVYSEDHCHKSRIEDIDTKARKKLIIASLLCVIFMMMEIIGGVWSNSLAIATDAAHLLTDFASFMISLFSIWVASRPATKKMPFGWYRAEVIGALSSVILIWLVTGILLFLAIERTVNTDFELDAPVMLITSVIGVAVNLVMGLTLHHHGHDEHSHQIHHSSDNINKNKHTKSYDSVEDVTTSNIVIQNNINVRAAFIHVLGDFIQSIGVFIAALIIYFEPSWCIVDPICTFLFSILVMFTTISIIKDVMNVLMEGIPRGFDYSEVEKTFMAIEGVIKVHNLRIWALSLDKTALSAHLVISREASPQNILQIATRNIHDRYQFFEMTLQIEEFHQKMEDCKQCKPPSE